jgi:hypothetical protein
MSEGCIFESSVPVPIVIMHSKCMIANKKSRGATAGTLGISQDQILRYKPKVRLINYNVRKVE